MHRAAEMLLKVGHQLGDLRTPERAVERAAFDVAHEKVQRRVIDIVEPTGSDAARGAKEHFAGLIPAGSNAEVQATHDEMRRLLTQQPEDAPGEFDKRQTSLRKIAATRGYTRPLTAGGDDSRLTYVDGQPQVMHSEQTDGTMRTLPVFSGGRQQRSKYHDVPNNPNAGPFYGYNNNGIDESKFANVPSAPVKADGSYDWDAISDYHGASRPSGRQAHSYIKVGSK
jgi:hypothetical protein